LQAAVLAHGADIGLAFDGDADRCFVVDERGAPVTPSAITALVAARQIDAEAAAGVDRADVVVVYNVICSRSVPETIAEAGGRAVRTRVGHSYIKAVMAEHDAIFGGEHSAHYYFRDFWFADTGMLAAMHVLATLGAQEGPLSELVRPYERYVGSGEINSRVQDVPAAVSRVRDWGEERGATVDRLKGLAMGTTDQDLWWLSLRPSNTEPLLRRSLEASVEATMARVRDEVLRMVRA